MSKKLVFDKDYETLVLSYEQAKKEVGKSIIEVGNVIDKALKDLGETKWQKWLKDSRVRLNLTQAYKFIAVSKFFQNNLQLTECIKSTGIEKAYLITKIEDEEIREELAGQIIDAEFTVKQTKQAVSIIKNENKTPTEAIETVKTLPKLLAVRPERKSVPIQEFNNLKAEYEKLLKEKQELEKCLKNKPESNIKNTISQEETALQEERLKKPVKSDLPEDTLNKERHSIVVKGWEIPIPAGIPFDENNTEKMKFSAMNTARNLYKLDLS